jgi:hypothetical protein
MSDYGLKTGVEKAVIVVLGSCILTPGIMRLGCYFVLVAVVL